MRDLYNKLNEVVQCVISKAYLPEIGFVDGRCGICLLIYYYAKNVDSKVIGFAESYIHSLFESVNNNTIISTGYAEGLAGIVATLAHLKKYKLCNEICIDNEINDFLLSEIKIEIEAGNFDFFYGSGGLIYSLLLQYECDNRLKNYLEEAIMSLRKSSFVDGSFTINNTILDFETGFPHGYASWVVILSKLVNHDVMVKSCLVILRRIVDVYISWLSTTVIDDNESVFPTNINQLTHRQTTHSRLGWCNGDYPCLYSLLYYANVVNDRELQGRLKPIVYKLLSRKHLIKNSVLDAGICHGASGIALFINRLSQIGPSGMFYDKERKFWSDIIMRFSCNDSSETAGFLKMYCKNDVIISEKSFGLLEGLTGIGLAFISLLYEEQKWDELILLS